MVVTTWIWESARPLFRALLATFLLGYFIGRSVYL